MEEAHLPRAHFLGGVRGKHVYFNYFPAGHWLRGKRARAAKRTHLKTRTKCEKTEKARNEVLAKKQREFG